MEQLVYWHWIVIGLGLIVLEMLLPGFILLWFGVSAIVVGILVALVPSMAWEVQLLLFAVLSIVSLFAFKKLRKGNIEDDPNATFMNQRGINLIGRKTVLIEAVVDGVGKITVDDTFWRVEAAEDMPVGTHIEITGASGATLTVSKSD